MALSQQGSVAALVVDVLRVPDEGLPMEVSIGAEELHLPEVSEVDFPGPVKLSAPDPRRRAGLLPGYGRRVDGHAVQPLRRAVNA